MSVEGLMNFFFRVPSMLDGNQWLLVAGLVTLVIITGIKTAPDIIRAIGDLIKARGSAPERAEPPPLKPPAKPKVESRKRLWLVEAKPDPQETDDGERGS